MPLAAARAGIRQSGGGEARVEVAEEHLAAGSEVGVEHVVGLIDAGMWRPQVGGLAVEMGQWATTPSTAR
jgi:hypothetical protein